MLKHICIHATNQPYKRLSCNRIRNCGNVRCLLTHVVNYLAELVNFPSQCFPCVQTLGCSKHQRAWRNHFSSTDRRRRWQCPRSRPSHPSPLTHRSQRRSRTPATRSWCRWRPSWPSSLSLPSWVPSLEESENLCTGALDGKTSENLSQSYHDESTLAKMWRR